MQDHKKSRFYCNMFLGSFRCLRVPNKTFSFKNMYVFIIMYEGYLLNWVH